MAAGDIVRWISNSSNDWATAANWSTGAIPGDNEIVLFDGTGLANVTGGDFSSTFQLRAITTQPEYTGNIGASGNPLIHNINTVSANPESFLTIRGTGDFYWQAGGAGVGGDMNYSALVDTAGNGTVFLDSDTATGSAVTVYVKSGKVIISGAVTSKLVVAGAKARVTMNEHVTDPVRIWMMAGKLTSARTINLATSVTVTGGEWIQTGLVSSVPIFIGKAARWDYRPPSAVTVGTIALMLNGVLDLAKSNFVTGWSSYVRGPFAREIGMAKQGPLALPASGGNYIDLRDEYPTGD